MSATAAEKYSFSMRQMFVEQILNSMNDDDTLLILSLIDAVLVFIINFERNKMQISNLS